MTMSFRAGGRANHCSNCARVGMQSANMPVERRAHLRSAAHVRRHRRRRRIGLPLIGRLLGHTQARTTQRYAHLADDPLNEAADKIAAAITGAGKGTKITRLRGGS